MSSVTTTPNMLTTLLRVKMSFRSLSSLGEGMNLFDSPPKAAGNSKFQLKPQIPNVNIFA